jgi:hypothetical protein
MGILPDTFRDLGAVGAFVAQYGVHTDRINTLNAVNGPAATPLLSTLPEVRTFSHPSRAR